MAALGGGVVLLLAGCASMPDSGGVHPVPLSDKREDTRTRTYAEPPEKDATPERIVSDFLEALRSDDYATMGQLYLTKDQRGWTPGETTVLAESPEVSQQRSPQAPRVPEELEELEDTLVELSGDRVAEVDGTGAYMPREDSFVTSVHLVREPKSRQWRISVPPEGLVISRADFDRTFQAASTYHFTARSRNALVADPVFVRRRLDPVTDAVATLLDGPGGLIRAAAQPTFPTGTELVAGQRLEVDKEGTLRVPLKLESRPAPVTCERMAAQVLYTAQSQEGVRVAKVELLAGRDAEVCELRASEGVAYAPGRLAGNPQSFYFVDDEQRLMKTSSRDDGGDSRPTRVISPFGEGKPPIGRAAVDRHEDKAAAVTTDGRRLYVSSLRVPSELGDPVLSSRSKGAAAGEGGAVGSAGLTAPSWDGLGDLWVADRVGDESRLYWLQAGESEPQRIDVPELDGRIEALRVSADGSRIALIVSSGDERRLLLGALSESRGVPVVADMSEIGALQDVRAVTWAGESRLIVVGRGVEGVQQMRLVSTDGSVPSAEELGQGLTGVTAVAASESGTKPLVAVSEDGIVRLPQDSFWTAVEGGAEATAPVYPG